MLCEQCEKFLGCKHGKRGTEACLKYKGWLTGDPAENGYYICTLLDVKLNRKKIGIVQWQGSTRWATAYDVIAYQPLPEVF